MASNDMTYMAVRVAGYQVTEEDFEELRSALAPLGDVRVSGAWEAAAAPPAYVAVVIGFFGAKLLDFLLGKGFDTVWEQMARAWSRYRDGRASRGQEIPTFDRIVLQCADCEVRINAEIEPGSKELLDVLRKLGQRLESGLLAGESIESVTLPCRQQPDGVWEEVRHPEEAASADFYVWHIRSRDVNGFYGYYDARSDARIDQIFA